MIGSRHIGGRWLGSGRVQRDDYTEVSGSLNAVAALRGLQVKASKAISGRLTATAGLIDAGNRGRAVSGSLTASGSLTGTVSRIRPISGRLTATSSASGAMRRTRSLSGSLSAVANLATSLVRRRAITGRLVATVQTSARISRLRSLTGRLVATARMSGRTIVGKAVTGSLRAVAEFRGRLSSFFVASPANRRLRVPPKDRRLIVPRMDRVRDFDGDDMDLALLEYEKLPAAVVDLHINMRRWFRTIPNDEITELEVTLDTPGLEIGPGGHPDSDILGRDRFRIWVGGGEVGVEYEGHALVHTKRGRVEEIDWIVRVVDHG